MTLISYVFNAYNGRYADALTRHTQYKGIDGKSPENETIGKRLAVM